MKNTTRLFFYMFFCISLFFIVSLDGCGSWLAASCRHGGIGALTIPSEEGFCDQRAIVEEGTDNAILWWAGLGPQPIREAFEYVDDTYEKQVDTDLCPVGNQEDQEADGEPVTETGEDETGNANGEAEPVAIEPVTATVILTWQERTDLDLAATPTDPELAALATNQMSWEFKPEGTILEDDTVCPDISGKEEMLLTEPGLYNVSVGVWSGCIIGEEQLPHFASYKIEVLYSDGRMTQTTGTIEGQIWQLVMQVQLP